MTGLRGTKQVSATVVGSARIKQLERELARKDKALAEAAALALLQKNDREPAQYFGRARPVGQKLLVVA